MNGEHLKFIIPSFRFTGLIENQTVPIGNGISHLFNSLHIASIYGRCGLSSNVGNLSLPTTASSSACARFCTCGKRTSARKREVIEDIVLIVGVDKKSAGVSEKHAQSLSQLER